MSASGWICQPHLENPMFKVDIFFKKGPAMTYTRIPAGTAIEAKIKALVCARAEGCREAVKKVTITEVAA